jgi:predicted permease
MDIFRRRHADRDLDEELKAHIAIEIERRVERGESAEVARTAALREVRSVAFVKEAARDVWAWASVERVAQDLRYAVRMLRKSPVFTAVAIVSLALGIGANTAIFSLVNAVLLRTLPVSSPEQLVLLTSFQRGGRVGNFAYPDYQRLRDRTQVFSGLLAASTVNLIDVGVGDETERAQVQIVSGNYFSVLGVRAGQGRMFTEDDDRLPVGVISHGFCKRTFGDDSAVGKRLTINGSSCRIVGVAPPEFLGESVGQATDIWVSIEMLQGIRPSPSDLRNVRFVTWANLMGRLKPGMNIEQARAEASALVAGIHAEFRTNAETDYLHHIAMEPGSRGLAKLREKLSDPLRILMAVVALVLLMACTNLASLLLARAASRRREIATRLALGASRRRLIRQLLTESVLLAVLGGALGLLFAVWSSQFLLTLVSAGTDSITLNLRPDGRILLFTAAVSVFTGILFGLAPAIQAVRRDVGPTLKMNSRTMVGQGRPWALRNVLIIIQVALSLVLLAGGGLFIRTLRNLKTMDAGFVADNVLLVGIGPHRGGQEANLAARLLERVVAIPGVRSASVSFNATLGDTGSGVYGLEIEGYTPRSKEDQQARADWVGPDYFETLGIPLLQGREFSLTDTANSERVVIINQTMARYYFGDRPAVGQRLHFNKKEYEIIGVARDAKYRELRESTPRMLYFAFLQNPAGLNTLEVRTTGSPLALAGAVREAIRDVDARLNVRGVVTLSSRIDRKLTREYLVADLSGFFSGLTLLLVSIGIYGTLAYAVAGRTNEIGVRMALGAKPASILLMILREIFWTLATGLLFGVLAVLACGPLVASLLFGLRPADPPTIVFAALLLGIVALAAGYIPARRASRVDPVAALRFE